MKHSILIIGGGSIGERHLRCFLQTKRADVAICDTNSGLLQKLEARYRVPIFSDWQAAFNEGDFTAVVICTPAPLHIPMALQVLKQKTHVLIEKPLSHSLEQVAELLHACQTTDVVAAVAYVFHQFPFLAQARAFLETSTLGAIRQVSHTSGQPFHLKRPGYAQSYYRDRKMGGGAIQDALTHSVNWVESILGPTDSVLCDCDHQALPDVEVEDTVHISARNGSVMVSYCLNQFQAPSASYLQINATHGSVRIEFHKQRWGIWAEGQSDWSWHDAPVEDQDTHFRAQANAFLDKIEGKPAYLCSIESAVHTLRFNLSSLASAESNARVQCQDIHE